MCPQNLIVFYGDKFTRPRLQILEDEMLEVPLAHEADAHTLFFLKHVMKLILSRNFLDESFG